MKDELRYVFGGAAVGAVLGALGGWLLMQYRRNPGAGPRNALVKAKELDRGQLARLGWMVIKVVRQIAELG